MNPTSYYAPGRQFRRALAAEWRLYGSELLYGVLYVAVGFYVFRRVGYSQVYIVGTPFALAAALMAYLTWRLCSPGVKRTTAPFFFNLPLDRAIALDARLVFLFLATVWFNGIVLLGSHFKLGGAGITACYRIHPEFAALPFLTAAATVWHLHRPHGKAHWITFGALFIAFICWLIWKVHGIEAISATKGNNFWPDREMPLKNQFLAAGILMAVAACLVLAARAGWRRRQIGEIR